nr:immunoglobulin heavy chain junction region [Macaca mulatta]MOY22084.1 immunoglobulin heavy chain junction region [Macaca mulatta]MOY22219.1 immunoglobulin heavy chain junction region [Macaca mulatta]MOY22889.1 immunoglobulin heavy chain junction region [Macaca mulatta]MOY23488.1 immunoglobulin heavy chain junction region [Macaca mulatta]
CARYEGDDYGSTYRFDVW